MKTDKSGYKPKSDYRQKSDSYRNRPEKGRSDKNRKYSDKKEKFREVAEQLKKLEDTPVRNSSKKNSSFVNAKDFQESLDLVRKLTSCFVDDDKEDDLEFSENSDSATSDQESSGNEKIQNLNQNNV